MRVDKPSKDKQAYNQKRRQKDAVKQAASLEGRAVYAANRSGKTVDEERREIIAKQQELRLLMQEKNELQAKSQSEAIHQLIVNSPKAVTVLAEMMVDPSVPAGVRRMCANDIATLSCLQDAVKRRMESNTKDVSEMSADELSAIIGSLQQAKDALDLAELGEIVATDPA